MGLVDIPLPMGLVCTGMFMNSANSRILSSLGQDGSVAGDNQRPFGLRQEIQCLLYGGRVGLGAGDRFQW